MKRQCECSHAFDDHAVQYFTDNKPPMYYCRICCGQSTPEFWCIEYTPIGNLKYLEQLNDKKPS